jgi:hypothetical protein
MATKAQIAAVAAAQKAFDTQLAKTQALSKQTALDVGRLTASQTPELTPTEQRIFKPTTSTGVSVGQTGVAPIVDPNATANLLAKQEADRIAEEKRRSGQSAYDIMLNEFNKYGLASLVEPLKGLITSGASPAEFSLALQNTDAYKKRFAANADRISKGLSALSPAEYIAAEDQYQNIMRNYGLPSSYWAKDSLGTQAGFNQLLSNDVSASELTDRINTAQSRVLNANPEVMTALKQFYPDINNGDILAYSLDPNKALTDIKNKVTAAEIGGAALSQGLQTSVAGATGLAGYGVTAQQAQQGYATIGQILPTGQKLADIYGETPYTQAQAESEIFNTANAAQAAQKRKKLTALEQAQFSGSSGTANNALNRDRAMSPMMLGVPGAGAY